MSSLPGTLGELRGSAYNESIQATRSVKDELRANLIRKLKSREELFPGIVGFDDTVVPQIVNAILSRHNFILLGLRGQAKNAAHPNADHSARSRGCHTSPAVKSGIIPTPQFAAPCRDLIAASGDSTPIAWLTPSERYIEKLATPDVTVADMIGDIDPIKAARGGHNISSELSVHYGLLPRAHRGIFAINELPDLAPRIQVSLFNIMQEGDIQIKGYPVRLPLDILLAFTANPEDYTARGKIITPLKDRIGSEIRTHYPAILEHGIAITREEAWLNRTTERTSGPELRVPVYITEIIEQVAFAARDDKRVDKRSGVSQRLPISATENVASNAERRAIAHGEDLAVPRVLDIYAALPAITGKIELEYEGELKGADTVARELIRAAVAKVFNRYFEGVNMQGVVQWFDLGGTLRLEEDADSAGMVRQLNAIQGLMEKTRAVGLTANEPDAVRAAAGEFILEGLHALRRIGRTAEQGFATEIKRPAADARAAGAGSDPEEPPKSRQRRQFN